MNNQHFVRFDKEITNIVKGCALILMMLLHCYAESNYEVALDFRYFIFRGFNDSFKICVWMFAFMVGYGYAFSKTKDLKYSLQHIKRLIIPYWTILFVFALPFCLDMVRENDLKVFIYNLFGITDTNGNAAVYLKFGWFVYFYIFSMLVMRFVSRFIDKHPVRNSIIAIAAFWGMGVLFHFVPDFLALFNVTVAPVARTNLPLSIFYCLIMAPIVVLGYLFARQGYYEKINISRCPKLLTLFICLIIIVVILTVLRPLTIINHNPFNPDFVYAPIMVGVIAVLFNKFKWNMARKALAEIGKLSAYMWFFHGLFYTKGVRWFYQPAITIFDDINLVVLWTICLTFCASWIIKGIVDAITKRITFH